MQHFQRAPVRHRARQKPNEQSRATDCRELGRGISEGHCRARMTVHVPERRGKMSPDEGIKT